MEERGFGGGHTNSSVCRPGCSGPGTDRIPEGVPKKFVRNRNRDSCEKSATGEENTGILRIPVGITNRGSRRQFPQIFF